MQSAKKRVEIIGIYSFAYNLSLHEDKAQSLHP